MMRSTRQPAAPLRVGLLQFAAGPVVAGNLDRLERWFDRAPAADLLVLPETVAVRGSDDDLRAAAETLQGPVAQWFAGQARRHGVWLAAGSMIERAGTAIYNTAVVFDPGGTIAAAYRKIHLFEARLPDQRMIRERDVFSGGETPVLLDIQGWTCGLSICYDLRFPELYRVYSAQGAQVVLAPSNFTQRTGRDHWEILLRARAIENQGFVLAPNQWGTNDATGVVSYGHSMAVGPWGEILARAGDGDAWLSAVLEPDRLTATRDRVPALEHRRLA